MSLLIHQKLKASSAQEDFLDFFGVLLGLWIFGVQGAFQDWDQLFVSVIPSVAVIT